jgi:hypothetical protein
VVKVSPLVGNLEVTLCEPFELLSNAGDFRAFCVKELAVLSLTSSLHAGNTGDDP